MSWIEKLEERKDEMLEPFFKAYGAITGEPHAIHSVQKNDAKKIYTVIVEEQKRLHLFITSPKNMLMVIRLKKLRK